MSFLIIDTETGGLDASKHSILSLAGIAWHPGIKEIENSFTFGIAEPEIFAMPEAIAVNKINTDHLKKYGYSPWAAINQIKIFLNQVFSNERKPIILIGHNVGFDISFLKRLYKLGGEDFYKDFSHRSIDTSSILSFLMCTGYLEFSSPKSDTLFEFCNVQVPEKDRHTALGDAVATFKALNVLIERFKNV